MNILYHNVVNDGLSMALTTDCCVAILDNIKIIIYLLNLCTYLITLSMQYANFCLSVYTYLLAKKDLKSIFG